MKAAKYPQYCPKITILPEDSIPEEDELFLKRIRALQQGIKKTSTRRSSIETFSDEVLLKQIKALQFGIRNLGGINRQLLLKLSAASNTPVVSKFMNLVANESNNSAKLKIFEKILEDNIRVRKEIGEN